MKRTLHFLFRPTSPNKRNTLLVIIITLLALPCLYVWLWYSKLTQRATKLEEDVAVSPSMTQDAITLKPLSNVIHPQSDVAFPAVAVFQKLDWTSQADISLAVRPKCFIGWFDESAPACDEASPGATCNCNQTWASEFVEPYVWRNTSYRMLLLPSSKDMVSHDPTTILLTQVFFTCTLHFNILPARHRG